MKRQRPIWRLDPGFVALDVQDGHHVCYAHDEEEISDGQKFHLECFECFHIYRTSWGLKFADIRQYLKVAKGPIFKTDLTWGGDSIFRRIRISAQIIFSSTDKIQSCPVCTHDF